MGNSSATSALLLTLNAGSSSLKFAGFSDAEPPQRRFHGEVQAIASAQARLTTDLEGIASDQPVGPTRADAIAAMLQVVSATPLCCGIGHRIVHPGLGLEGHQVITPRVRDQLGAAVVFDPVHLPLALAVIDALHAAFPQVPQVACLDTAFHRDMPRAAQLLPLPRRWQDVGLRRLGFHGLSYAYLLHEVERLDGPVAANGRLVLAHLGAGASMAALREGRCQDTTMSFTPLAGLVMATRPGDLDPGVVAYLASHERLDGHALHAMLATECGLKGVSGGVSDMRQLQERRQTDGAAADAIDLFCHQARRCLGSMIMSLGGLETLVFAGGIGEHDASVRAAICAEMGFLGLHLDAEANAAHRDLISAADSRIRIRIIRTDEEQMMARIVRPFCLPSPIPHPGAQP